MKHNILIVEDDKNISKLLKYNLEKANFLCEVVFNAEDAWDIVNNKKIDLIILDIMLPGMDGLSFCRTIKQDKHLAFIPIIMLTAKAEEIDKIVGFELGVDDYVVKPFSPRELVLRIKAVLNRGKWENKENILSIGCLTMDLDRYQVILNKREIKLTAMEFKLLKVLMDRCGRVQSRENLLYDVWDINADITTRTVDTHIKRLRQKLKKYGKCIETVRGYGYKLNEKVLF